MFAILHALGMFVADLFKSRSRLEGREFVSPPSTHDRYAAGTTIPPFLASMRVVSSATALFYECETGREIRQRSRSVATSITSASACLCARGRYSAIVEGV
jgi:hypothetical protein